MDMQEFLKKISTNDKEIEAKFKACKTPEEAYAAAQGIGLTASYDVFAQEVRKLSSEITKVSDADLETVVGNPALRAKIEEEQPSGTLSTAAIAITMAAG